MTLKTNISMKLRCGFGKTSGRFPFRLGAFLGASDEPLHSLCSLQGLICDADPQGVAQSPLQSTISHGISLIYSHKKKFQ
jgi:hypothetical protein